MAHTKPEQLRDLAVVLAALRRLPGLVEKKPGIFYFKSISFLLESAEFSVLNWLAFLPSYNFA